MAGSTPFIIMTIIFVTEFIENIQGKLEYLKFGVHFIVRF